MHIASSPSFRRVKAGACVRNLSVALAVDDYCETLIWPVKDNLKLEPDEDVKDGSYVSDVFYSVAQHPRPRPLSLLAAVRSSQTSRGLHIFER